MENASEINSFLKNSKPYEKDILLTITVYPYFMAKSPKFISYLPYKLYIRPKLKNYLDSVIKGIDWYLKKKENVPRNAFGKHSWFS